MIPFNQTNNPKIGSVISFKYTPSKSFPVKIENAHFFRPRPDIVWKELCRKRAIPYWVTTEQKRETEEILCDVEDVTDNSLIEKSSEFKSQLYFVHLVLDHIQGA